MAVIASLIPTERPSGVDVLPALRYEIGLQTARCDPHRLEFAAEDEPARFELALREVTSLDDRLRQAWTDPNPSPRIEALRKQIAAGQVGTETFWAQVARDGTPLVEPFGDDGKYQLVTFP